MGESERTTLLTAGEMIALTRGVRQRLVDVLDAEKIHPAVGCLAMALIQAAVLDGAVRDFRDPEELAELREGIQTTLGFTVKGVE